MSLLVFGFALVTVTTTAEAQVRVGDVGPSERRGDSDPSREAADAVGVERDDADGISRADIARGLRRLRALSGRAVAAVDVVAVGTTWTDTMTPQSVRVGDRLTASLARRALREVLDSGKFAQAYVDARPAPGARAVLRLVVLPRRIIAGVNLLGGRGDARRMLQRAGLEEGRELTEPGLARSIGVMRDFYRDEGYDQPDIAVATNPTDVALEVLVDIRVDPGPRQRVARRIFVIDPDLAVQVGELKNRYRVGRGDVVDEASLTEADDDMADALRSAGFFSAAVKHRVLRRDGLAFLYVYLETGPLHRLYFQGHRRQDEGDLRNALGLDRPLGDTSPEALREKLLAHYRDRGLLDVRITVEERTVAAGAVREVRFSIVEGATVRVAGRSYPCLPAESDEGFTADEMDEEIDAVLEDILPGMPLFHEVDGGTVDIAIGQGGGRRAIARRLRPDVTYTEGAYARVVQHLSELLASKGYLNARVGPLSVIRAECDPAARGGRCRPFTVPPLPVAQCRVDPLGLPVPEPSLDEIYTCVPDPTRSITCAPEARIHLPIQLGPRSRLYDLVFEGNRVLSSAELEAAADFELGAPLSNVELDAALTRVRRAYQNEGYYYATVTTAVDLSPDRTRARARFIINEQKPVVIDSYEVRGAYNTDPELVLSRLALCIELPDCTDDERRFRRNLVRQSEEQIATLGTFSSVSVALEDPDIPTERKRVIITVSELKSQYIEPSAGFYTGDGIRLGAEYGHRNIAGQAISLTLRLEFAFLPDFLIFNEAVRDNYTALPLTDRIERRNTGSLRFPDIGLGAQVDFVINAVDARDNQRDFGLTREALLPTLNYRPVRTVTLQFGVSGELNDTQLFNFENINDAIQDNPNLRTLLRVPDGRSVAIAQRISANWDRRDKPLAATRGTLLNASVEHVSAFPLEPGSFSSDDTEGGFRSEFLRFNAQVAGYVPLGAGGWSLAVSVAGGYNLQLTDESETYPDRLFYLGGVSNIRGFQVDSVVPQDLAEQVVAGEIDLTAVGVRGGNVYLNPRVEMRIPVTELVATGLFLDTGNTWLNPEVIADLSDLLQFRYTAGAGARFATPVGPIAFDVGFPLRRFEWEEVAAVHLGIGLF
ncbi:MAG: POTRA domain-containing protein [Myxococcota bacterium]